MITEAIKRCIDKTVLCWLATCSPDGEPNVSPKEMFLSQDDATLLVAHIASPHTIRNIMQNPKVCVSFVDVFVQKGFKLKGVANICRPGDALYAEKLQLLTDKFTDAFPVKAIIVITVTKVDEIKAPSYFLYPGRTEDEHIQLTMVTYGVKPAL